MGKWGPDFNPPYPQKSQEEWWPIFVIPVLARQKIGLVPTHQDLDVISSIHGKQTKDRNTAPQTKQIKNRRCGVCLESASFMFNERHCLIILSGEE